MARIILDTDIGSDVDDAMALSLAMRSPEITIEGVTTVYGDVQLRARLAKKLLRLGRREEIPVYAGIERTLLHNREIWWTGHEGEGALTPEDDDLVIEQEHAVDFIIRTVMNNPGEITLVPIGPLTNIAAAIIREPRLIHNVKEIIMMGGVSRLGDNAADLPYIEHNIKCDPEAASLVFSCGIPIVMVGLDVTMKVLITTKEKDELARSGNELNVALSRLLDRWLTFMQKDRSALHDPLAVSLLLDRSLVKTEKMHVHIQYDHRHPSGQTIAVRPEFSGSGTNTPFEGEKPQAKAHVEVCMDVDNERFIELIVDRLVTSS